jgi:HD-GYP domain-containing protein (c-di-GMP phosphodiesterase class II)
LYCRYEVGDVVLGEAGKYIDQDSTITLCFKNKRTIVQSDIYIKTRGLSGDKVSIPLMLSDQIIGAVFLESGIPQTLKEVNISFIENLANYAAIAIKNAELFSNVFAQKQEIQALYEQAAAVNGTLNTYVNELDVTKIELEEKNKVLTDFYQKIQSDYFNTVMALANSIEAKDAYTRGHCQRVMEISCEIAKRMGYNEDQIQDLRYASVLHDIGKIGIPAHILRKQSKLTDEEYEEIKKHPLISYTILKDVYFLENASMAILQHHERYDGGGYPNGLKGDQIREYARIMNIADAFDAMTSDRPYRKAMTMEIALAEIKYGRGTQFDPQVADIFIEMGNELIVDSPV